MSGSTKVKDLFINRKIPCPRRGHIPLLFHGDQLLWVCGVRLSSHARPNEHTRRSVMVEILDYSPY
jgi:tRNA(Ile)-lysidine synthase